MCVGGLLSPVRCPPGPSPSCRLHGSSRKRVRRSAVVPHRSIVHIDTPKTIADGAQTQHVGVLPFEIIRREVDDIYTATDAELVEAMRIFAGTLKIVVEPTGCLAFAAVRRLAPDLAGQRIGVLVSGGNVDLARFTELLAG